MSDTESIPTMAQARVHRDRVAVIAAEGTFSHGELLAVSARVASGLCAQGGDLAQARVAFMATAGLAYVATLWGIWRAGGVAVPLCTTHPEPELSYTLEDADAAYVVASPDDARRLAPIAHRQSRRLLTITQLMAADQQPLPQIIAERPALIVYTSGTTGKPKGALSTHRILEAQCRALLQAWELTPSDRILHVLPLHHLHGILNALCAPLFAGGSCELAPRFDAKEVFRRIAHAQELSLFMAVPTVYSKLATEWDAANPDERAAFRAGCERLRLMVSGSAALPVSMLDRWRERSGHTLLERYGMTELGMALGQPLHGERRPGSVGVPFPSVQARLVDDEGRTLGDDAPGALEIRGPNVFREYFRKPEATAAAFTPDGWFRTGDVAVREHGGYRLLGRSSVDILKTGGYKVSALEIEEALREHPAIEEVCIVGVADEQWGQRVAAAVVLRDGASLDIEALRAFGKQRLASYKVPSLLRVVGTLPRNAMGKVQKTEVQALWNAAADSGR